MDDHELAAAALRGFAHSSARDAGVAAVAAPRSSSVATGIDMKMDSNLNAFQGQQQKQFPGSHETMPSGKQRESQDGTTLGLQPISSNNSQSTTDGREDAVTPPTSTSDGLSSHSASQEAPLSQLSHLSDIASHLAEAREHISSYASPSRPNLNVTVTAGQKRTADGQVKTGVSPTSPHGHGHTRNTSTVSSASAASTRIGELSSELRTRLSYAMVKVNNGWQSNSIDEVESLASQAGSPTSSTSTLQGRRNLIASPRVAIANAQEQSSSSISHPVMQAPMADFDLYARNDQPSRTYESFWKAHSTTLPAQRPPHMTSPPQVARALAPPADIRPTPGTRRSQTSKFSKPPTMPGHGTPHATSFNSTPRTPLVSHRDPTLSLKTPSQQTLQEQDAIESLIFMSSPGNSGNMGHTFSNRGHHDSPLESPLRTEFSIHSQDPPRRRIGRHVEFERTGTSNSTGSSEAGGAERVRAKAKWEAQEARIEKLLDDVPDSSSDEEEIIINHSSPRRLTSGRV